LPDAVPPAGGAGVVLTGLGFGAGVVDGFALTDVLEVGVTAALVGAAVEREADAPAPEAVALEAAAGETAALETAALETAALETAPLETAGPADDAVPLALPTALDGVPSGAA
jgi:hypothetical protein